MDTSVREHGRQFDRAFSGAALERASDDRLVALTRDGVDPAFEVIVRRYRPALVRYGSRFLDADRAEDVVQQALVKALAALRQDRRRMQLKPWLYRIVHNEALNASRRRELATEQLDENFDGVPQPPDVVARSDRLHEVVAGISGLPERQRSAVVLRELEGRSYSDIAGKLGVSPPVVRQLLHRARTRLRDTCGALLPLQALRAWAEAITSPTGASAVKVGTAAVVTTVIAGGAAVGVESRHAGSHHGAGNEAAATAPAKVSAPRNTVTAPPRTAPPRSVHAPARRSAATTAPRNPGLETQREPSSERPARAGSPGSHERPSGQHKDGHSQDAAPADGQSSSGDGSGDPVSVAGEEQHGSSDGSGSGSGEAPPSGSGDSTDTTP